jgi:MFS family permease
VLALVAAAGFLWLEIPSTHARREAVPFSTVVRVPAVAACSAAVVVGGGTIAMFEPMLSLYLADAIGLGPARIGFVFGGGAIASAFLHPLAGRLGDRWGARRLTMAGLFALALMLPVIGRIWSFESALVVCIVNAAPMALLITPSLAYMAEATSSAGSGSFGVAYGLYNFAWAIGLLGGPALGGFLYERLGFQGLLVVWTPALIALAMLIVTIGRTGKEKTA